MKSYSVLDVINKSDTDDRTRLFHSDKDQSISHQFCMKIWWCPEISDLLADLQDIRFYSGWIFAHFYIISRLESFACISTLKGVSEGERKCRVRINIFEDIWHRLMWSARTMNECDVIVISTVSNECSRLDIITGLVQRERERKRQSESERETGLLTNVRDGSVSA